MKTIKHIKKFLIGGAIGAVPYVAYRIAKHFLKSKHIPEKIEEKLHRIGAHECCGHCRHERNVDDASETDKGAPSYQAVVHFTKDATVDGENYTSTGTDENVIHVSGNADVTITHTAITRTSKDSAANAKNDFYGVGAAVIATDGTAVLEHCQITTDANGGSAVASIGAGVVRIFDSTIQTAGEHADGLLVSERGMIDAQNLTVETSGAHSSAVQMGRGDGSIIVDGGTYLTTGDYSPAIFGLSNQKEEGGVSMTAIHHATMSASESEAVLLDGNHILHLYDTELASKLTVKKRRAGMPNALWSILLLNNNEESEFQMVGGSITTQEGGVIYAKNSKAGLYLSNVSIHYPKQTDFFLCLFASSMKFTAVHQSIIGDLIASNASKLTLYLKDASTLTGAILMKKVQSDEEDRTDIVVNIAADATWIVTGDSVVTSLHQEGTIRDADGNDVRIVDQDDNVQREGSSHYQITVEHYDRRADFSGAASAGSFEEIAL